MGLQPSKTLLHKAQCDYWRLDAPVYQMDPDLDSSHLRC